MSHVHRDDHRHRGAPETSASVKDPVCGMDVVPGDAAGGSAAHDGVTYWFCSPHCRERFVAEPGRFVAAPSAARPHAAPSAHVPARGPSPPAADARTYTCPMHPQIRQQGPGSCPICGMALEPLVAAGDEGPDPELIDMTRRLVLTLPLLVSVMADMLPGAPLRHLVPARVSAWAQLVLATPVVLWAGGPFFVRGWASLVNRSVNMFTLIALGVGVAYVYSVVAVLAPGRFPDSLRTHGGEVGLYFEAAAVITVLVLLGQVLELRARGQTSSAIRALLQLAPKTARRVRDDGADEEISLEDVRAGDRLRVRPGEAVPVESCGPGPT